MEGERSSSSFSDWESVRDEDDNGSSRQNDDGEGRVVLELPPEGLAGASGAAVAIEASGADGTSAAGSSLSSFVPVSRFDNMNVSAIPSSAASSYQYDEDDPSSSSLSNFELLSLSSGEAVRKCRRCKFHNSRDSVVCASCDLALVANPNLDADAQIAMHLQQKEEADARAALREVERKRERVQSHPLHAHACILANDIREVPSIATYALQGGFRTLPQDDLVELALRFVQWAVDQPAPKEIAFVYKCTPHAGLESVRANGLPADRPVGEAATDVEVGFTLEEAFDSFETLGMMNGEPLRPIPEDGEDGTAAAKPKPRCLCWIVAAVRSAMDPPGDVFPPAQTLPLAYFDSSYEDEEGGLDRLLDGIQRVFAVFFVKNLQLPIVVTDPPGKRVKLGSMELVQQEARQVDGEGANEVTQPAVEPSSARDDIRDGAIDAHSGSEDGKPGPVLEKEDMEIFSDEHAPTMPLSTEERVTAIAVFGNGLAVCCNKDLLLLSRDEGLYKKLEGAGAKVSCLASYHGRLLATGGALGNVVVHNLWQNEDGEIDDVLVLDSVLDRGHHHHGQHLLIVDLCFLTNGKAVAATNMMRVCRLWSVENGSCICTMVGECPEMAYSLPQSYQKLQAARFSPDGNCLASVADGSPSIHLWDLHNNKTRQLAGHESTPDFIGRPVYNIRALSFSPDGKYLASAANDCTIRIWDLQKKDSPCVKITRVPRAVSTLDISPDSTRIAGGCVDGAIRVWDGRADSSDSLQVIESSKGSIRTLVFLPDGNALASIGWSDSSLRIWEEHAL